jgi:hypothetical protein
MSRSKRDSSLSKIPDLIQPLRGILKSDEELEYGLRGVVRILGRRGKNGKNGYFFEGFKTVFASEIGEEIQYEETFLDYENLKIVIKLPDPLDSSMKESIRHQITKDYTLGADDLKTRAALVAFEGLDDKTKKSLIEKEKGFEKERQK